MASEPVFELVLESDDIGRVELKLDNKRAERYRQVEALGASGELAAGIGAEFREIIGAIGNFVELFYPPSVHRDTN